MGRTKTVPVLHPQKTDHLEDRSLSLLASALLSLAEEMIRTEHDSDEPSSNEAEGTITASNTLAPCNSTQRMK
jgi:hypothetical protein